MPTFYYIDEPSKRRWFASQEAARRYRVARAAEGSGEVEIEAIWVPRLTKRAVLELLRRHSTPSSDDTDVDDGAFD